MHRCSKTKKLEICRTLPPIVCLITMNYAGKVIICSIAFMCFVLLQSTRPRIGMDDIPEKKPDEHHFKHGVHPYPQFLPLPFFGFQRLPLSYYGYRPPEAHRSGSIASLRLKAREYEAALEMQNIFKT